VLFASLIPVGVLLGVHGLLRNTTLETVVEKTPWPVRALALFAMLLALLLFPGVDRAFIYFQF
jgi:hypothetical protein